MNRKSLTGLVLAGSAALGLNNHSKANLFFSQPIEYWRQNSDLTYTKLPDDTTFLYRGDEIRTEVSFPKVLDYETLYLHLFKVTPSYDPLFPPRGSWDFLEDYTPPEGIYTTDVNFPIEDRNGFHSLAFQGTRVIYHPIDGHIYDFSDSYLFMGDYYFNVVPEPSPLAGAALGACILASRRRKNSKVA